MDAFAIDAVGLIDLPVGENRAMDLLVIGGTRFLGRRIVESALANGHSVTLFYRGKDGAELFDGKVEKIFGDRDGELDKLAGRRWDAVVDTPGYYPRVVRASAEYLRDKVERYLFISSISVYNPAQRATSMDENTPTSKLEGEVVEEFSGATYGPLKALCEKEVNDVYGSDATILRPGYIVGSFDPTDRFTYYPWRLLQGGRMLVGGRKDAPLQVIDARDVGRFSISALEQDAGGTYNVSGPAHPMGWEEWLLRAKAALGSTANFVWQDAQKLEDAGLKPGADLPLYHGADTSTDSFMRADNSRAVEKGLTFTPLEDTVRDTAKWLSTRGEDPLKVGMTLEREAELLSALGV
jgi:2'-hydroxyisoflavone reductase